MDEAEVIDEAVDVEFDWYQEDEDDYFEEDEYEPEQEPFQYSCGCKLVVSCCACSGREGLICSTIHFLWNVHRVYEYNRVEVCPSHFHLNDHKTWILSPGGNTRSEIAAIRSAAGISHRSMTNNERRWADMNRVSWQSQAPSATKVVMSW